MKGTELGASESAVPFQKERRTAVSLVNAILPIGVLLLANAPSASAAEHVTLSGRAMGTTWSVKYAAPAAVPIDPREVERRIVERLEQLEQQFSTYRTDSEISCFNASSGNEWMPVSREVVYLALEARRMSELTGGAFDVTVNPLVRLWGFGATGLAKGIPTHDEIATAQARVGWERLDARESPAALRRTRPGVTVDFSSMAKGFASDELGAVLNRFGARDHFVQIGGDIKTGGHSADEVPWRAAIETPDDEQRLVVFVVKLTGQALSTSGDYRNFVIRAGRRYGHIIDPRSGFPADTGLAAVSVVDASCARSSALATALFVLGPTQGYKLAMEQKLACVFFVRRANGFDRRTTPAFDALAR